MKVRTLRPMAVAVAVLAAGSAHAVDIQPMDWTPAPSGTHALSFYSFLGENDGVNLGGARLEGSLNSSADRRVQSVSCAQSRL